MEFVRKMKLDDKKLTHLANTTIHVADIFYTSLSLMEHAALIIYNTQGLGIKLIFHQIFIQDKNYWNYFMSKHPLLDSTIQIKRKDLLSQEYAKSSDFCERFVGNKHATKSVLFLMVHYYY